MRDRFLKVNLDPEQEFYTGKSSRTSISEEEKDSDNKVGEIVLVQLYQHNEDPESMLNPRN